MKYRSFPRRSIRIVLAGVVLAAGWMLAQTGSANSAGQSPETPQLPGARAEIDASKFESLQAAFDALPKEGGLVRIPPGQFSITQPLRVSRSDVTIQGAGAATHIQNNNESGLPALIIEHADGEKVKAADKLWRVMLSNVRITGNPRSGTGIDARQVNEIFLQGVTVSHHGADGIRLDRCYEDPRVSDCLITYNKQTGLNLPGCHDIVVCGNQFEENRDAVHCFDGFNLCMTGNCLDDHLGDGVVIENTYGSVLTGNMIEECDGRAIVISRDCYGITMSANVIAHNGGGIDLMDAHGCAVSANTFVLLKPPAKPAEGKPPVELTTRCLRIGPDSSRIAVSGNSFCDSFIGTGAKMRKLGDQHSGGIVLEDTRDVAITGNTFSGLPKALEVRGAKSSSVVFSMNVLTETHGDQHQLQDSIVHENVVADDQPK